MVSVNGYPPTDIKFCPECGSADIEINDHWNSGDGLLVCGSCGLQCYIIEGDESHTEG